MTVPPDFVSRDELLGGLPARRAGMLLFAIEGRTARLVDRSRRAMAPGVTERSADAREQAFLEALAEGRELPLRPSIQDLERYAPVWEPLVPSDPALRAAVARAIGERYAFNRPRVPRLRAALGLDEEAVAAAYGRLYGRPLESVFAEELPLRGRLRWARAAASWRLESLPPVWTAFALTLTETVGAGVLALPIALAGVGPAAGVAFLVVLGVVNLATVAAVVEAITRDGDIRYGTAYFGRLVGNYLGRPGTAVLTPALLVLSLLPLVAFYFGVATTMADVTAVPATVWAALLFLAGVAVLRRENLNATVASALVVGAVNLALLSALVLLALPHVEERNLRNADVPLLGGGAFDASALALVFGIVLASYFGHTSAGNAAKVVLRRDPGGRALMVGNVAAIGVAIALYCVWIVAVNGAVEPAAMTGTTGTALAPLAAEVGPLVHVFGTAFVILAMGMGSVHKALGASNQMREWLPAPAPARSRQRGGWARIGALAGGRRFWLAMAPVAAIFLFVEWLLVSGRGSFVFPLSLNGTLIVPLLGGVFPILMLVAARRKGEYVPASAARVVGHPVAVPLLAAVYLGGILAHGLVLWEAPLERAAALAVFVLITGLVIVVARRGVFDPRVFVEVRADAGQGDRIHVVVTASGRPLPGSARLTVARGDEPDSAPAAQRLADLRSVTVSLPATRARRLKVRVHRVTLEGDSEPLPATLALKTQAEEFRLAPDDRDGVAWLRIHGEPSELRIALAEPNRPRV